MEIFDRSKAPNLFNVLAQFREYYRTAKVLQYEYAILVMLEPLDMGKDGMGMDLGGLYNTGKFTDDLIGKNPEPLTLLLRELFRDVIQPDAITNDSVCDNCGSTCFLQGVYKNSENVIKACSEVICNNCGKPLQQK